MAEMASPSPPPAFAPSSKARALLADSSDSETESVPTTRTRKRPESSLQPSDSEDEEDDDPISSKIASRLLGNHQPTTKPTSTTELADESKTSMETSASIRSSSRSASPDARSVCSSPYKRRRLTARDGREDPPYSDEDDRHHETEAPSQSIAVPSDTKSRFEALVAKKREERQALEAAEASKRAEREKRLAEQEALQVQPHRVRGSSPADDSEEDEDISTVTKSARPTRKASKKAIEEMNRETQRISRNMQLAHQTRTKTKISKDSLLARFGIQQQPQAQDENAQKTPEVDKAPSSSHASSENELEMIHSTPPTSPISPPKSHMPSERARALPAESTRTTNEDEPSLEELLADRAAAKVLERPGDRQFSTVQRAELPRAWHTDLKTKIRQKVVPDDSDDELEVVDAPGMRRKFVAFEKLPVKKAKEQPSHLALRSLANIKMEDNTSHNPNSASMQLSLRRLAREQARQERDEKIAEYRARNPFAQSEEERQEDQLQIEDAHDRYEKAKQEAVDIRKRERQEAKKDGTFAKDDLDDGEDSDDEDEDFYDEQSQDGTLSGSDADMEDADEDSSDDEERKNDKGEEDINNTEAPSEMPAMAVDTDNTSTALSQHEDADQKVFGDDNSNLSAALRTPAPIRQSRKMRIVLDDDDDDEEVDIIGRMPAKSPALTSARKTPQSIIRSARKIIPGLQPADDLPSGLTQAFAATMADDDSEEESTTQDQEIMAMMQNVPSPHIQPISQLRRLSSIDMVSESLPASQAQPLDISVALSQSQPVPESPSMASHVGSTQIPFDLTQDVGYRFSQYAGSRFSETPRRAPHSTVDTVILPSTAESPTVTRRGRLRRGHDDVAVNSDDEERSALSNVKQSAFQVMHKAARRKEARDKFLKDKSEARQAFDEDAEESDDEYAGLGGVDGEEFDSENEDDRAMIDQNDDVGHGDEPGHAMFHADHERKREEKEVSKMLHNVQTGAWRRKRAGDDLLELSDEEGERLARRKRKQEEWKRMRDALMMDEGLNKFARDSKRAEAFLKSIEDREEFEADSEDEGGEETQETQEDSVPTNPDGETQNLDNSIPATGDQPQESSTSGFRLPLAAVPSSHLNTTSSTNQPLRTNSRQLTQANLTRTLSELLEPVDSQATIDLSDSDSEPEQTHYTNLNRHYATAEADEDSAEDMGDFIVDDENSQFKKPSLPERAPFNERRTRRPQTERSGPIVDRLSLLRQASSSSASGTGSGTSRMAFFTGNTGGNNPSSLLRRATTNSSVSSLGAMSGRGEVSATGVTIATERGSASVEKEFVRKGSGGRRNAVNYVVKRVSLAEGRMSVRAGVQKTGKSKAGTSKGGFLGSLFRGDSWA